MQDTIETHVAKITANASAAVQVVNGDVIFSVGSSDSAVTVGVAFTPDAAMQLSDMISTASGSRQSRELAMTNGTWRCGPADDGFSLEFDQDEQDTSVSVLMRSREVALDIAGALAQAAMKVRGGDEDA